MYLCAGWSDCLPRYINLVACLRVLVSLECWIVRWLTIQPVHTHITHTKENAKERVHKEVCIRFSPTLPLRGRSRITHLEMRLQHIPHYFIETGIRGKQNAILRLWFVFLLLYCVSNCVSDLTLNKLLHFDINVSPYGLREVLLHSLHQQGKALNHANHLHHMTGSR